MPATPKRPRTHRLKKSAQPTIGQFIPQLDTSDLTQRSKIHIYLGRSLGLKISSRDGLIQEIKRGLRVTTLNYFSKRIALQERELAHYADISTRSLARRKKEGRLNSDESDRLVRLSMLFDEATDLFEGGRERASQWFLSPKRALGGKSPIEYADTEPGAQEVRDLMGRIEHGVFS